MYPLTRYYIHQAGGGGSSCSGDGGVGPIYSVPPFVQRGHGLGSFLGGLFRSLRPFVFSAGKAIGREALRTGSRILTDMADNPQQLAVKEIISKNLQDTVQNLGSRMTGRGRKRKRRSTSRAKSKKTPKRRTTKKKTKKPTRKRTVARRNNTSIKRDIFS